MPEEKKEAAWIRLHQDLVQSNTLQEIGRKEKAAWAEF